MRKGRRSNRECVGGFTHFWMFVLWKENSVLYSTTESPPLPLPPALLSNRLWRIQQSKSQNWTKHVTDTSAMVQKTPFCGAMKREDTISTLKGKICSDGKDEWAVWAVSLQALGMKSAFGQPFCSQSWYIQAPLEPLLKLKHFVLCLTWCGPADTFPANRAVSYWALTATIDIFSPEFVDFLYNVPKLWMKRMYDVFKSSVTSPKYWFEFGELRRGRLASVPISSTISHGLIFGSKKKPSNTAMTQVCTLTAWQVVLMRCHVKINVLHHVSAGHVWIASSYFTGRKCSQRS